MIIQKEAIDNLRKKFKEYLKELHPEWEESTVATHYTDAFFALNNNVGFDFWDSFSSDEKLLEARRKIRNFLQEENSAANVDERAGQYYSSMKLFKEFLDANADVFDELQTNPDTETTNIEKEFENWMGFQAKHGGGLFKRGTIRAYINALRNGTAFLDLPNIEKNLFSYANFQSFSPIYTIIKQAPDFKVVDQRYANAAYSRGLFFYEKFLKEREAPSIWIFQGNPKYYDVAGAVTNLNAIRWGTPQSFKQIKAGHKVYIWVSGADGGIVAQGTVLTDPAMLERKASDPYYKEGANTASPYMAVDIKLEKKFVDNVILRKRLVADARTKRMGVLTYPGATNYSVTPEEDKVIQDMIQGAYVPIDTPSGEPRVPDKKRYWVYAPGRDAAHWDEFYKKGIMAIGWDYAGDASKLQSLGETKARMKERNNPDFSYINSGLAVWQFAHEMNVGDIIFVKTSRRKLIGRGIVESDYEYDESRTQYRHVRKVKWTHKGEWEVNQQFVAKTLTDITPFIEYCQMLENVFLNDETDEDDELAVPYNRYTKDSFLSEVYLDEKSYDTLAALLRTKKNLILQGAPGVGKTFLAKRLAFSMMGEEDTNRVMQVQFHQSYGYEDFVMGYRPNSEGNGFYLAKGPFYTFCKRAAQDIDNDYFFIIDEINRGNISKIFGELLMLIEADKRGSEIRLLYGDELFAVPRNLHIIGMMNTADRSLALIDYALRRRFAFFELAPAFESEGFAGYQRLLSNHKFDKLIETVRTLNKVISEDPSLGRGFCIGHSYFCNKEAESQDTLSLSSLVEYELIPLIDEYWFDDPTKCGEWAERLRKSLNG